MAYESTDTVIYRPDGLDAVTLCKQGDLMAAPVDVTASVQVQRDGVLGSSWMRQRARGNALMQLSFTVPIRARQRRRRGPGAWTSRNCSRCIRWGASPG